MATDYETLKFYECLSGWGSADVDRAIEIFNEVGLSSGDLAEQVQEYADSTGSPLNSIDVCYVAYEHILQHARDEISNILNYDFINDGEEIYTYGNCLATNYDYETEDKDKLQEVIDKATKEQKEKIKQDVLTSWFLEQLEIEIKK